MRMKTVSRANWLALIIPTALLAGAYGSQVIGGLYPCEMCWWQRYPHFAAVPIALLGFFISNTGLKRVTVALAAFAILTSGIIGGFHAGVEYGWWPGLSSCSNVPTGNADEVLKQIMNAPLVRCDVAPWTLFGISLAGFNFLISTLGALTVLGSIWRGRSV
jgi:disulfide bond formation protein DsbB